MLESELMCGIPVVDKRGRCVATVSQADVALYSPPAQASKLLCEIPKPLKSDENFHLEKGYFYCGQFHEQHEILLLNRGQELPKEVEVVL